MEQYIPKAALVAEIERRLEAISSSSNENNRELAAIRGAQQYELINLALFLDTLEVKESPTDAFIEKATFFIQQHWIWNTKMIEDFKKYMEE